MGWEGNLGRWGLGDQSGSRAWDVRDVSDVSDVWMAWRCPVGDAIRQDGALQRRTVPASRTTTATRCTASFEGVGAQSATWIMCQQE